jgi:hypothetical protein
MATIKEIIAIEEENNSNIYLYSEGIFWKAYQRSAYMFLQHCRVNYMVKHRFVKSVLREVYSIGFPHSALPKLFKEDEIEYLDEKKIRVTAGNIPIGDYEEWVRTFMLQNTPNKNASELNVIATARTT